MNLQFWKRRSARKVGDLLTEIATLREAVKDNASLEELIEQLRDANQNLVIATVHAQTMKDEADSALKALELARQDIQLGLIRYTDLYDFAPTGYFTLEADSAVIQANLTGGDLLGRTKEQLVGIPLRTFIAEDFTQIFDAFLLRVFSHRDKHTCEVMLQRSAGGYIYARIEAVADATNQTCRVAVVDITQRKSAEDALAVAHNELEIRVKARTAELECAIEQLRVEIEERKRVEHALQASKENLRLLSMHQEHLKESERKRIARDIHDDLGQNLLALKIDISMLHARTGDAHPRLNQRAADCLNHIDAMVKSVKEIMNNLRPSVLDLGLYAALEWQASEFSQRTGIPCTLRVDESVIDVHLDSAHATALFRIGQESLSNIFRHARASQVSISLERQDNHLAMEVTDNGVGIHPDCRRKANSFGLIGIEERVFTMGGIMSVHNGKRNIGTVMRVSIPITESAATATQFKNEQPN